jgi:hypothetical protein
MPVSHCTVAVSTQPLHSSALHTSTDRRDTARSISDREALRGSLVVEGTRDERPESEAVLAFLCYERIRCGVVDRVRQHQHRAMR